MQSILKTPTSFSEYAESRPSTKIVSFQVFLGKPSKCEKNFLVIESYVTRCMTNLKTSGLILENFSENQFSNLEFKFHKYYRYFQKSKAVFLIVLL